ncbi:MAG: DegT/DnrJ/EryC1/StrS family aminotransferase [Balneolales bacterium]|nr:DegT/DnrJ/EryC1/StrS family aminotransferase [Balneolales bacterium]
MIPILDLSAEIDEIRSDIDKAIKKVIDDTRFIMGDEVKVFESACADYLGVKHAIGLNSGTDALLIALKAAGIKEGDEVITTPFSFFATAESISMAGAIPVFVDIDEATFNIDAEAIESSITAKTKAIMPVHLYGRCCSMGRVMEIAEKHGLTVIEDCAQAFGATYLPESCIKAREKKEASNSCNCSPEWQHRLKGSKAGTMGLAGAFSFFPSKNLGAFGDGGLIATNNDDLAETASMLRVHGARKKYHNEVLGFNSRLDTIQAAVLLAKLPHIDRWNKRRLAAAGIYNMLLEQAGLTENLITTPAALQGDVFHQYTIRLNVNEIGKTRDQIQKELSDIGIGSMVYYPVPQDKLPVYTGQYTPQPLSAKAAEEVLSLPIWPLITMKTQEQVVDGLRKVVLG